MQSRRPILPTRRPHVRTAVAINQSRVSLFSSSPPKSAIAVAVAPNLPAVCAKFPGMLFVIDHLAHNGNDGGEMEAWGPAIDELGSE